MSHGLLLYWTVSVFSILDYANAVTHLSGYHSRQYVLINLLT